MLRLRVLLTARGAAVLAEVLGTAALVGAVVGSGVMATRLTDDTGLQLLINALATVAVLGVAIATFVPISGAHFNPAVTLVLLLRREVTAAAAAAYVVAQGCGALLGTVVAHVMFDEPLFSSYVGDRTGTGTFVGEVVATTGLLVVILIGRAPVAVTVPAWILGAYFFTSSTSFANPAVTLGRAFTDTFSGIAWSDVPWFWTAQLAGAAVALALTRLFKEPAA